MGMSIQVLYEKFKSTLLRDEVLVSALIIVVGVSAFYLGRLSVGESPKNLEAATQKTQESHITERAETPRVEEIGVEESSTKRASETNAEGGYVASKSGTKYHLPWCGSAKQIKEENKIWFATKAEAEAAGYTPAANCKGI